MSTDLVSLPANLELPAHLRTPEAAAEIAAANAAAAGGIKTGGFPSISIKANKFHIKENGELNTLMMAAQPGQPALPLMCLEVVVLDANPAINKTYYAGDFVEGADPKEPECRSSNGITPDADVAQKQNDVCATCKQNQWGSKVSKFSQKDIKACDDSKQLAVVPAADLSFKALGLQVHKGSLKNWGLYVKALSDRGYPITGLVTNITFDATQNGVLNFAFNRFLTVEQSAKVAERKQGADVKLITAQSRAAVPQLAAPASTAALPGVTVAAPAPAAPAPQGVTFPPEAAPAAVSAGFGAAPAPVDQPAGMAAQPAPAEAPKRTRRTREQIEADKAAASGVVSKTGSIDLSYLPPAIAAAINAVGADSPAGVAMLAQFPAPAAPAAPADPFAGQPAHVKPAVEAAGGLGTAGGDAVFAALKVAAPQVPPAQAMNTQATPVAAATATAVPAVAAPAAIGFGGATIAVNGVGTTGVTAAPTAAVTDAAAALKSKLEALLKPRAA